MGQQVTLRARGLYTHPNPYGEVPDGALETADNVVIDREGIVSPRRGFVQQTYSFATNTDRAHQLTEFQGNLLAHYATTKLAYYNSGSGWQNLTGSFTAPTDVRTRFVQANGNLYFTTNAGVKKLEAYNGTPASVGVPAALGATLSTTGGSGFFTTGNQIAYRLVWGIKDANNNEITGAPSQRLELANSSGSSKDVQLVITIPSGITTSHFLQIYRSALSGGASVEASEEMYLVYETNPTSSDIAAKSITITDQQPVDLTGATLYTSPSQEGILKANDQPPLAKDIAVFKEHMFYANTIGKHRFTITLLGVGGSGGLANSDTIVVAGTTYTAKTVPAAATDFQLTTGGSAASNIQETALALVNKINSYASNTTVYARYLSGSEDLPGQILIEERGVGGSSFTITTSRATAWSPDATGGETSDNDTWLNGLFYSKFQQPEAVPSLNFKRVGSASDPILRIVSLRDGLFVFKQTEGVWRLTGTDESNFEIDKFDGSTRLLAPETIAELNNAIYGLFDQGVCSVSDTGVQVLSRPIERTLLELQGEALSTVKSLSWAVSYESDRKYIINLPSSSGDTYTTQAFVWDTFTKTWVRWDISKSCGYVRPSENKLYAGDALANRVSMERKAYTFSDHVDESVPVTISGTSGLVMTLNDVSSAAVGDVLFQSSTVYATISEVDINNFTVTVDYDPGFTAASATILKAFEAVVKWAPFHAGAPMMSKQFREVCLLFDKQGRDSSIKLSTEIIKAESTISIVGTSTGAWGTFGWGSVPWGGSTGSKMVRTYVSREHHRAAVLSVSWIHAVGYSKWALAGIQITFNAVGERVSR